MSWVKIDDQMPHHPKEQAADLEGFGFDVAGIAYASRYRTDGLIADHSIETVFPRAARKARRIAQRLVETERWHRSGHDCPTCPPCPAGHYLIHGYAEFQPESTVIAARRAEVSAKRSEAGRKGAARRWSTPEVSTGKPDGKPDGNLPYPLPYPLPSRGDGKPIAPSPYPSKELTTSDNSHPQSVDCHEDENRVAAAISILANQDRTNHEHRGNTITNPAAFLAACHRNRQHNTQQLQTLADQHPEWTPQQLATAITAPPPDLYQPEPIPDTLQPPANADHARRLRNQIRGA